MSAMDQLPDALLTEILSKVKSIPELLPLGCVSKRWHGIVQTLVSDSDLLPCKKQCNSIRAVIDGYWSQPLFLAAAERCRDPSNVRPSEQRMDFSSFCIPDTRATQDTVALVTDGHRIILLDDSWSMIQGHIPPLFQASPHRSYQRHVAATPVPVGSIPDFSSLRLLVLQPSTHGATHAAQQRRLPHVYGSFSTWPPSSPHFTKQSLPYGVQHHLLSSITKQQPRSFTATAAQSSSHGSSSPLLLRIDSSHGSVHTATVQNGSTYVSDITRHQGLTIMLPRSPMWVPTESTNSNSHGMSFADAALPGTSSKSIKTAARSSTSRSQTYTPVSYDSQTDVAFQLLCKALALPTPIHYLDISHQTELKDSDILLVLSKCYKSLSHFIAAGTQAGPATIAMLGAQDRLNLSSLNLSYSLCTSRICRTLSHSLNISDASNGCAPVSKTGSSCSKAASNGFGNNGMALDGELSQHRNNLGPVPVSSRSPGTSSMSTPPKSLVSGSLVADEGLRHRHPSQLETIAATAASKPHLSGIGAGATGIENAHQHGSSHSNGFVVEQNQQGPDHHQFALGGGSSVAFNKLLRSALGRLNNLTDLRLAGNDLHGVFFPLTNGKAAGKPLIRGHQQQQEQQQELQIGKSVETSMAVVHAAGAQLQPDNALPQQTAARFETGLLVTLSSLRVLDISHSCGINMSQLLNVLHVAVNLEVLYADGCTDSATEQRQCQSQSTQHQQQPACKLKHLRAGWGFNTRILTQLVTHASERLAILQLGLGAGITDTLLATVAQHCPLLQQLQLQMASVSDEGVRAILAGCPHLHVLHLEQCTGPFTAQMIPYTTTDTTHVAHFDQLQTQPSNDDEHRQEQCTTCGVPCDCQSKHNKDSKHRWTLTELHLCGPTVHLNDQHIRTLIGSRPGTLNSLALSNCPFITPATLAYLASTHKSSLKHVRLEHCGGGSTYDSSNSLQQPYINGFSCGHNNGACVHASKSTSTSLSSPPSVFHRPASSVWRFSQPDFLTFLQDCPGLLSLSLRHCCQLSSSFVESAAAACPLLSHLMLDQCDLVEKGIRITQQPYSPLQQVMVVRCKVVEPALSPQLPDVISNGKDVSLSSLGHTPSTDVKAHATTPAMPGLVNRLQRRVESDIMIHDLLEGRTNTLPFV